MRTLSHHIHQADGDMRKIRFRVWDGERMHYTSFGRVNGYDGPTIKTDRPLDCTWMQYTGLKDRRGRDAYEDDFATGAGMTPDGKRIDFAGRIAITPTKGVVFSMGNTEMAYADVMCFDVIGNIYEHPELLETTPVG